MSVDSFLSDSWHFTVVASY